MTVTVQIADPIMSASNIWGANAASDTFWLAQGTANKQPRGSGIYSSFDNFTAIIDGTVCSDNNGIYATGHHAQAIIGTTGVISAIGKPFGKLWARSRTAWACRRSPSAAMTT